MINEDNGLDMSGLWDQGRSHHHVFAVLFDGIDL